MAIPVGMATQGQNQQPPDYVVADLGTLGGTRGEANAVSNKGSSVTQSNMLSCGEKN